MALSAAVASATTLRSASVSGWNGAMVRRLSSICAMSDMPDSTVITPSSDAAKRSAQDFTDEHVNWLNVVLCLRATGMSIGDVRHYIELCEQGDSTLRERYEIMLRQKERAEEELREVQRKFEVLSHKLSLYENLLAEKEREA